MTITNEAMTANLQIGVWMGHRLDKDASKAVTDANAAESDAARVNKHLIPKEALRPIITAMGAVRTHFYSKTLPWKDNGDRLLTRKIFTGFLQEHERLVTAFREAVSDFLDRTYPSARAQAEFRMGNLFRLEDYPSADHLRQKFYINLDIDAVTEAGDFRVTMDQDQLDSIQADMTQAMQDRLGKAMGEVWTRLATTLGHFSERMKGDTTFKVSTITNLEELLELLPALNIMNDPDLERIRKDIKGALNGVNAKDLRGDPAVRTVVAQETQQIMDDMAGFMKAFGGGS